MALSPSFEINFDCNWESLTFTETTGSYDASTNTGGYGSPNIETSDVDSTQLIIENLLTDVTFDTITTISVSSTGTEVELDFTDLLVDGAEVYTDGDHLPDGIYSFTFNVIDGATTYTYTVRKLILPDLWCDLNNTMLDIVDHTCSCDNNELIADYLKGFAFVKSLEGSAICGDISQFQTLYDKTQTILENLGCNC